MTIRTLTLIAMVLSLLAGPALADKYYRWVDDEGVTHYTKNPPEGREAQEVNTGYKASSSQEQEMKELESMRQQREQAREQAEKQAELEKRKAENPEEVSEEFCKQHRENLETLQNKPIVRRKNPETGEMEVVGEDEKQKMIEETRKALEKCK